MGNASVSGLVSGLDTATIISQLMQIEAQPQTVLRAKLGTEQSKVSTLQALNAKFAALAAKAHDLAAPSAWSPSKVTSSSDRVTANAGTTAVPGAFTFTVKQTATAHRISFGVTAKGSDVVVSGAGVRLDKLDGSPATVLPTGTGTLDELVSAVNDANAGIVATKVRLTDGSFRLSLSATGTGAASDFTLTSSDGSAILTTATAPTTVTTGRDAQILVGSDLISSSGNTFTGLLQGVDVTLSHGTAAETVVDISVTRDAGAAQTALQGLVDAANDLLTQLDKLTAYDNITKKAGALSGDSVLRDLRTRVLDSVTRAADGSSMAALGVQTDRYGKVTFDTAKFANAYAADPSVVATKVGAAGTGAVPGFAARLETTAKLASDGTTGVLTQSIKGRQSSVATMQDGIVDWDVRLATRRGALTRRFASLEVSLSTMQNQASWLAGQIAQLPSSSR